MRAAERLKNSHRENVAAQRTKALTNNAINWNLAAGTWFKVATL